MFEWINVFCNVLEFWKWAHTCHKLLNNIKNLFFFYYNYIEFYFSYTLTFSWNLKISFRITNLTIHWFSLSLFSVSWSISKFKSTPFEQFLYPSNRGIVLISLKVIFAHNQCCWYILFYKSLSKSLAERLTGWL